MGLNKIKQLKFSKFIKDILMTGFAQVLVLLLGMLFLKIAAGVLDEKHFGIFMVIRRWGAVLAPLLSLNFALSITKFVSAEREKEKHFLTLSFVTVSGIFLVLGIIVLFSGQSFSHLFFSSGRYVFLSRLFFAFVYADALYLLIYAVYRGRQQMLKANSLNVVWFLFPVLLMAVFLLPGWQDKYAVVKWYYLLFAVTVIIAAYFYFGARGIFSIRKMLRLRLEKDKPFLIYGLGRIPASLFLTLLFLMPVFFATHGISLEAAGYVGISVAVLRMMELASYPFNMIFLPKFSELKGKAGSREVHEKSFIVVDFIISFLPVVVAMVYGLSRHIVVFWFGNKFAAAVPGLKTLILFSVFFMAYAMIRGILNGVFLFPYVNVICLSGFVVGVILAVFFLNKTVAGLCLAFGIALAVMGISAVYILVKKLALFPPLTGFLQSFAWTAVVFGGLFLSDAAVTGWKLNIYAEFSLLILVRALIAAALFLLFWRKTLWYNELKKRIGTHV
jgi:O-antigen/teichoic acid export membrane protein